MKPYLTTNEQKAVFEFISRIKAELSEELIFARLFGSKVRGDFDSESDIDILLIVREYKNSVIEKIVDAQVDLLLEYDANISPVVFSENEYKKNKELGSPFLGILKKKALSYEKKGTGKISIRIGDRKIGILKIVKRYSLRINFSVCHLSLRGTK